MEILNIISEHSFGNMKLTGISLSIKYMNFEHHRVTDLDKTTLLG